MPYKQLHVDTLLRRRGTSFVVPRVVHSEMGWQLEWNGNDGMKVEWNGMEWNGDMAHQHWIPDDRM